MLHHVAPFNLLFALSPMVLGICCGLVELSRGPWLLDRVRQRCREIPGRDEGQWSWPDGNGKWIDDRYTYVVGQYGHNICVLGTYMRQYGESH